MRLIVYMVLLTCLFGCSEDTSNEKYKQNTKQIDSKKIITAKNMTGKGIYTRYCSACHGESGEKVALSQSKIIKGWTEKKTILVLNGYKDKTYGGKYKDLMNGQVKGLDEKKIELVAKYISTL